MSTLCRAYVVGHLAPSTATRRPTDRVENTRRLRGSTSVPMQINLRRAVDAFSRGEPGAAGLALTAALHRVHPPAGLHHAREALAAGWAAEFRRVGLTGWGLHAFTTFTSPLGPIPFLGRYLVGFFDY